VQEVLRMMLEVYYEPLFRNCSHGFRPGRGCHTALGYIRRFFRGTVWFIEGDIKGCFDNIDHDVLMRILARRIHDGRILELVRRYLKAGYLEDWTYHRTYSGTPQGGVLSPLLANIYLHELDEFIVEELRPRYHRGERRSPNPEYLQLSGRIQRLKRKGNIADAKALIGERRRLPSHTPCEDGFRRLRYCRYADDFVLGFIGPKTEAEEVKREIGTFLREKLHLDMSEEKTLITHARTGHAVFLNYDLSVYQSNNYITAKGTRPIKRRSANGQVRLGLPYRLVDEKCKPYLSQGKPIPKIGSMAYSDGHIIATYQTMYRGLAEYYKYAVDRHRLVNLKHVMECSLTKTLASKYRVSVSEIYRRYRNTCTVNGYTYKTLQVAVHKGDQEIAIRWGAIPLRVDKTLQATIDDRQTVVYQSRSDLIRRLLCQECELCGGTERLEVHHVRKLADLETRWRGRREKPRWVRTMIAMRRKTLVVCHACHTEIHRCGA
jgi:group II intron reverse transcriptase/maturase